MDLTNEQWEALEPLIPDPPRREDGRGRPWRDPWRAAGSRIGTSAPWMQRMKIGAYGGDITPTMT